MDKEVMEAVRAIGEAVRGSQRPQPTPARWRWGTVAQVNDDGTMDVEVGGSTLPAVRALTSAMGAKVGDRVRVDYLDTDAVVTGVRATDGYGVDFRNLGNNPISSTADDTVANWRALGNGSAFFNTTGKLNGQPSQYGLVINLVGGNDAFQLWHGQRDEELRYRGGNTIGGYGPWRRLPDVETGSYTLPSNNYLPLGSGYKDYTISFSHTFRAVPNVQLTLAGGSTASEMCNVQVGVYAVTTTNFTARFWYQLTADGRQPTLRWLAVAT